MNTLQNDVLFNGTDSEDSELESSDDDDISDSDSNYHPETDSDDYDSDSETEIESASVMSRFEANETSHKEPKYIVFHNQLLLLLSICFACFSKNVAITYVTCGSMLTGYIKCLSCKTVRVWKSQPDIAGTPMGNILLSGAILYSGSLPSKFLKCLKFISIKGISNRTFFRHQRRFLHNVVRNLWLERRTISSCNYKD